jgi:pSer/pThr/pTyr-binding forkhead associated (FHA) protein
MPREENDITLPVLSGPDGDTFPVRADEPAALGRAVGCNVCLPREGSRHHAELGRRDGVRYIRDAGSLHGTCLNGVRRATTPLLPEAGCRHTLGFLAKSAGFFVRRTRLLTATPAAHSRWRAARCIDARIV